MITTFRWDAAARSGRWIEASALDTLGALPTGDDVMWIDLHDPTEEEERTVLAEWFPIHALTLEDITRLRRLPESPPHLPKVEEFPDYLFVVVNPLAPGMADRLLARKEHDDGHHLPTTQLSALLTPSLLITHHYRPLDSIETLRSHLKRHATQCVRGPDYLFHIALDDTIDQYAPVFDHLDDELDLIEERVFARPTHTLLQRLLRLKRLVVILRKTLHHEREVLFRLQRGDLALIDERERAYYRNVYDHLLRFTELIEGARDLVTDLMQSHLAAISNRLNEVMKALATVSTIVLPMTLIAGIYGMNFEASTEPPFSSPHGFAFALGLMGLTGLASYTFFKWRRWT